MSKLFKMFLSSFVLNVLVVFAFGQVNPVVKPGTKSVARPQSFKLKTLLGKNEGEATVTLDEGLQLLNFPLRVVDDKNNSCTIISYNLMYKRKGMVEDETTGKKDITFTSVGDRFTTTPLPGIWKENISETLKKEEELFFFDIIIRDKFGRKTFAPQLKIRIQ